MFIKTKSSIKKPRIWKALAEPQLKVSAAAEVSLKNLGSLQFLLSFGIKSQAGAGSAQPLGY